MTMLRICRFSIMLVVVAAGLPAGPQDADRHPSGSFPSLANVCLITNDMKRLVGFYEPILALKARWSGEDYAEFRTSAGTLAVFAAQAQSPGMESRVSAME